MLTEPLKKKLREELDAYVGLPSNEENSAKILKTVESFYARHDLQFNSRPRIDIEAKLDS